MDKKKLVIGVIGADVHAVGNTILQHAFEDAGFEVTNLGVMVSQEEYIAKASALARDWDTLEALHLGLRNMLQASVLMDGMGYTRALEQQYEKIWAQKMAGR